MRRKVKSLRRVRLMAWIGWRFFLGDFLLFSSSLLLLLLPLGLSRLCSGDENNDVGEEEDLCILSLS